MELYSWFILVCFFAKIRKSEEQKAASSCQHSGVLDDVSLEGGERSNNYTLIKNVHNMKNCVKKCCHKNNCDLAMFRHGKCYSVNCNLDGSCRIVHTKSSTRDGGEIAFITKSSSDDSAHRSQHKKSKNIRRKITKHFKGDDVNNPKERKFTSQRKPKNTLKEKKISHNTVKKLRNLPTYWKTEEKVEKNSKNNSNPSKISHSYVNVTYEYTNNSKPNHNKNTNKYNSSFHTYTESKQNFNENGYYSSSEYNSYSGAKNGTKGSKISDNLPLYDGVFDVYNNGDGYAHNGNTTPENTTLPYNDKQDDLDYSVFQGYDPYGYMHNIKEIPMNEKWDNGPADTDHQGNSIDNSNTSSQGGNSTLKTYPTQENNSRIFKPTESAKQKNEPTADNFVTEITEELETNTNNNNNNNNEDLSSGAEVGISEDGAIITKVAMENRTSPNKFVASSENITKSPFNYSRPLQTNSFDDGLSEKSPANTTNGDIYHFNDQELPSKYFNNTRYYYNGDNGTAHTSTESDTSSEYTYNRNNQTLKHAAAVKNAFGDVGDTEMFKGNNYSYTYSPQPTQGDHHNNVYTANYTSSRQDGYQRLTPTKNLYVDQIMMELQTEGGQNSPTNQSKLDSNAYTSPTSLPINNWYHNGSNFNNLPATQNQNNISNVNFLAKGTHENAMKSENDNKGPTENDSDDEEDQDDKMEPEREKEFATMQQESNTSRVQNSDFLKNNTSNLYNSGYYYQYGIGNRTRVTTSIAVPSSRQSGSLFDATNMNTDFATGKNNDSYWLNKEKGNYSPNTNYYNYNLYNQGNYNVKGSKQDSLKNDMPQSTSDDDTQIKFDQNSNSENDEDEDEDGGEDDDEENYEDKKIKETDILEGNANITTVGETLFPKPKNNDSDVTEIENEFEYSSGDDVNDDVESGSADDDKQRKRKSKSTKKKEIQEHLKKIQAGYDTFANVAESKTGLPKDPAVLVIAAELQSDSGSGSGNENDDGSNGEEDGDLGNNENRKLKDGLSSESGSRVRNSSSYGVGYQENEDDVPISLYDKTQYARHGAAAPSLVSNAKKPPTKQASYVHAKQRENYKQHVAQKIPYNQSKNTKDANVFQQGHNSDLTKMSDSSSHGNKDTVYEGSAYDEKDENEGDISEAEDVNEEPNYLDVVSSDNSTFKDGYHQGNNATAVVTNSSKTYWGYQQYSQQFDFKNRNRIQKETNGTSYQNLYSPKPTVRPQQVLKPASWSSKVATNQPHYNNSEYNGKGEESSDNTLRTPRPAEHSTRRSTIPWWKNNSTNSSHSSYAYVKTTPTRQNYKGKEASIAAVRIDKKPPKKSFLPLLNRSMEMLTNPFQNTFEDNAIGNNWEQQQVGYEQMEQPFRFYQQQQQQQQQQQRQQQMFQSYVQASHKKRKHHKRTHSRPQDETNNRLIPIGALPNFLKHHHSRMVIRKGENKKFHNKKKHTFMINTGIKANSLLGQMLTGDQLGNDDLQSDNFPELNSDIRQFATQMALSNPNENLLTNKKHHHPNIPESEVDYTGSTGNNNVYPVNQQNNEYGIKLSSPSIQNDFAPKVPQENQQYTIDNINYEPNKVYHSPVNQENLNEVYPQSIHNQEVTGITDETEGTTSHQSTKEPNEIINSLANANLNQDIIEAKKLLKMDELSGVSEELSKIPGLQQLPGFPQIPIEKNAQRHIEASGNGVDLRDMNALNKNGQTPPAFRKGYPRVYYGRKNQQPYPNVRPMNMNPNMNPKINRFNSPMNFRKERRPFGIFNTRNNQPYPLMMAGKKKDQLRNPSNFTETYTNDEKQKVGLLSVTRYFMNEPSSETPLSINITDNPGDENKGDMEELGQDKNLTEQASSPIEVNINGEQSSQQQSLTNQTQTKASNVGSSGDSGEIKNDISVKNNNSVNNIELSWQNVTVKNASNTTNENNLKSFESDDANVTEGDHIGWKAKGEKLEPINKKEDSGGNFTNKDNDKSKGEPINESLKEKGRTKTESYVSKTSNDASKTEGYASKANNDDSKIDAYPSKASSDAPKTDGYPSKANNDDSKIDAYPSKASSDAPKKDGYASKANNDAPKTDGYPSKANNDALKTDAYPSKANNDALKTDAYPSMASNDAPKTYRYVSKTSNDTSKTVKYISKADATPHEDSWKEVIVASKHVEQNKKGVKSMQGKYLQKPKDRDNTQKNRNLNKMSQEQTPDKVGKKNAAADNTVRKLSQELRKTTKSKQIVPGHKFFHALKEVLVSRLHSLNNRGDVMIPRDDPNSLMHETSKKTIKQKGKTKKSNKQSKKGKQRKVVKDVSIEETSILKTNPHKKKTKQRVNDEKKKTKKPKDVVNSNNPSRKIPGKSSLDSPSHKIPGKSSLDSPSRKIPGKSPKRNRSHKLKSKLSKHHIKQKVAKESTLIILPMEEKQDQINYDEPNDRMKVTQSNLNSQDDYGHKHPMDGHRYGDTNYQATHKWANHDFSARQGHYGMHNDTADNHDNKDEWANKDPNNTQTANDQQQFATEQEVHSIEKETEITNKLGEFNILANSLSNKLNNLNMASGMRNIPFGDWKSFINNQKILEGIKQARQQVANRHLNADPTCNRGLTVRGATLRGGVLSGEFKSMGVVDTQKSCVDLCCQSKRGCDVAMTIGRECINIKCFNKKMCTIAPAGNLAVLNNVLPVVTFIRKPKLNGKRSLISRPFTVNEAIRQLDESENEELKTMIHDILKDDYYL